MWGVGSTKFTDFEIIGGGGGGWVQLNPPPFMESVGTTYLRTVMIKTQPANFKPMTCGIFRFSQLWGGLFGKDTEWLMLTN